MLRNVRIGQIDPLRRRVKCLRHVVDIDGCMLEAGNRCPGFWRKAVDLLKCGPRRGVDDNIRFDVAVYGPRTDIHVRDRFAENQPVAKCLSHAPPRFADAKRLWVVENGMTRLDCVRVVFFATAERVLVGDAWKFVQPIRPKCVQIVSEHLPVVWQHVVFGDALSQFPVYPIRELQRHRNPGVATRCRNVREVSLLMAFVQLPDVGLERAADCLPMDGNAGVAIELIPFVFRQKVENEVRDDWATDIEKMPATDVDWTSGNDSRAAEASGFRLLFKNDEITESTLQKRTGKRETARPRANDGQFCFH